MRRLLLAGLLLLVGACSVDRMADRVRGVPGTDGGPGTGAADGAAEAGPFDAAVDATVDGSLEGGTDAATDGGTDAADACTPGTWYADADGDGYGDPAVTATACAQPPGYVDNADDCNDDPAMNGAEIKPGATEVCNGIDDDCDGTTDGSDAADATVYYADCDGDGYAPMAAATQRSCAAPSSAPAGCSSGRWVTTEPADAASTDCDDTDPNRYPGATAVCNGRDDNCDGLVDDDAEFVGIDPADRCTGSNFVGEPCTVRHWTSGEGGSGAAYLFCRADGYDWQNAEERCSGNGSGYHLVAIESLEEQMWLQAQIDGLMGNGWRDDWWIGARDNLSDDVVPDGHDQDQHWFWMNTTPPTEFCENPDSDAAGCDAVGGAYVNWGGSDPDRSGDCAVMSRGNGRRLQGGWYDRGCGNTNYFVCESPPASP